MTNDPPLKETPSSLTDENGGNTSIEDLAHSTSNYVQAWSGLLTSETKLASASLIKLGFAALVFPAIALGVCIAADALLASLLQHWIRDWSICIAITVAADIGVMGVLVFAMRRWWRNLSLPRSRAALTRLMEQMK